MKKLVFVLVLFAISLAGYPQATPGKTVRVATRTTVFGSNIPTGTSIFCVSDSTFWVARGAAVSTLHINTGIAAGLIMQISTTSGQRYSQIYEATLDSLTPPSHVVLDFAPLDSTGMTLSMNGVELKRGATGQYLLVTTLASKQIHMKIPVYKYDVISVEYRK